MKYLMILITVIITTSCSLAPTPSCSVFKFEITTTITCSDGTTSVVTDGSNGVNGSNGLNGTNGVNGVDGKDSVPSPLDVVAILAPCAKDAMSPTKEELNDPMLEVFLKLRNGLVLSSVSQNIQGYNTHFGILSPGTYMSTGTGNCVFTFTETGDIIKR